MVNTSVSSESQRSYLYPSINLCPALFIQLFSKLHKLGLLCAIQQRHKGGRTLRFPGIGCFGLLGYPAALRRALLAVFILIRIEDVGSLESVSKNESSSNGSPYLIVLLVKGL